MIGLCGSQCCFCLRMARAGYFGLVVLWSLTVPAATPPIITVQPQSQTNVAGTEVH